MKTVFINISISFLDEFDRGEARLLPAETPARQKEGRPAVYTAKVTGTIQDCMSRQKGYKSEGVLPTL